MPQLNEQARALSGAYPVGAPYVLGLWHKDRASYRGYLREAKAFLEGVGGVDPARKFLIFGRARSGTTLLVRLLNQVDGIRCEGEVLHFAVAKPRSYLNHLARQARTPTYGCKLLSYQLYEVQRECDPRRFFDNLRKDGFLFVHATRDTLNQCISLSIAQNVRQFNRKGKNTNIAIDVKLFIKQLEWNIALLEYENSIMREFNHYKVHYEFDLQDGNAHQQTIDSLCGFLKVRSSPVEAKMKKIITERLEDTVVNFEEVRGAMLASGHGALLRA